VSAVLALALPMLLSGIGVVVAAATFANRDKPDWQANARALLALAVGQVLLGAFAWYLLHR
jgi:hypothetical protein